MKECAAHCNALLLILCSFLGLILGYMGRSALVCLMVLLVYVWLVFLLPSKWMILQCSHGYSIPEYGF
jgi:hypothetical protein